MEDNSNLIWAGSELGYLKSVDPCKNIVKNYGEGNEEGRLNAPNALTWSDVKEDRILCGTKSGQVKIFVTDTGTFSENTLDTGESPIVGIIIYNGKMVACNTNGEMSIWDGDHKVFDKEIRNNVCAFRQYTNFVGLGGKENNLKIFDIERMEKPVFVAKNVRNDFLDLRQPVWVTAIDFIGGEQCKVAVGTGHHKIQIYDTRKQRRPIDEIVWGDYPITSMALEPSGHDVIVGNTIGNMASIDLRKKQKSGNFKGIKGSISSIKCHHSQEFVVCVGLDRWLRIYDIKTRSLLQNLYLKSRLGCVLLSENPYGNEIFGRDFSCESSAIKSSKPVQAGSDEADDSIWNEMEPVTDGILAKSRKKKILENADSKKTKKIKVSSDQGQK